jgi:hypothetical protein
MEEVTARGLRMYQVAPDFIKIMAKQGTYHIFAQYAWQTIIGTNVRRCAKLQF